MIELTTEEQENLLDQLFIIYQQRIKEIQGNGKPCRILGTDTVFNGIVLDDNLLTADASANITKHVVVHAQGSDYMVLDVIPAAGKQILKTAKVSGRLDTFIIDGEKLLSAHDSIPYTRIDNTVYVFPGSVRTGNIFSLTCDCLYEVTNIIRTANGLDQLAVAIYAGGLE